VKELEPTDRELLTRVPVLPLPEYTLFPNTLVPFHVYEPRFRRMLADCLADGRLLVVAALAPGWEHRAEADVPEVLPVAGLGRVLSDRRYPDGRVDIFVHGIARVSITGPLAVEPWLAADARRLPDRSRAALGTALQRLIALASRLLAGVGDEGEPARQLLASSPDAAVLSNRLAAALVEPFELRQTILELRCPTARCEALFSYLAGRVLESDEPMGPRDEVSGGWVGH